MNILMTIITMLLNAIGIKTKAQINEERIAKLNAMIMAKSNIDCTQRLGVNRKTGELVTMKTLSHRARRLESKKRLAKLAAKVKRDNSFNNYRQVIIHNTTGEVKFVKTRKGFIPANLEKRKDVNGKLISTYYNLPTVKSNLLEDVGYLLTEGMSIDRIKAAMVA